MKQRSPREMIKTGEPFEDEHFEAILELPLSAYDREFVEFFRKNRNKPHTAYQLVEAGFAEKGRFASVNRVCRDHGLWLGVRQVNQSSWRQGLLWDRVYHAFFVLKPAQDAGGLPRQHFKLIPGGKAR